MSKELEALEELNHAIHRDIEISYQRMDYLLNEIEKALTPPTKEEIIDELRKEYQLDLGEDIIFENNKFYVKENNTKDFICGIGFSGFEMADEELSLSLMSKIIRFLESQGDENE